jgi:hypothetical protein
MHPLDNAETLLRVLREPRRNKYFYGKRMDVQHFRMEQDYGKLKQWLLNRLTLGKGVLCGLRVSVSSGRVCVEPGVAIDGLGREIIVPMRYCLDPVVVDDGCCGAHPTPPAAQPGGNGTGGNANIGGTTGLSTHGPVGTPTNTGNGGLGQVVDGLFTLWLCYRECLTDHQPVMVSECGTRDECAAGTLVESFCLKFASGMAPPLGDPDWCAGLWATGNDESLPTSLDDVQKAAAQTALDSRRHALCELFDGDCAPIEGDPCVPLAWVQVSDGVVTTESCLVRPRIYSNQKLLDLILCLAAKVDECCNDHPPATPLQVRSVDFIRRDPAGGAEAAVAAVQDPKQDTAVNINGRTNAIRIRFNRAFATDQHAPTTHPLNDPNFSVHNVQVLPDKPLNSLPYVPGSLVVEAPDTVRFDLFNDSPYSRGIDGWQKGRYRIALRGTEDLAQSRQALADTSGQALDGEPIVPAGGVMSGDGTAGGDFSATFTVGGGTSPPAQPPRLMHVRKIEFVGIGPRGNEQLIGVVKKPAETVELTENLGAIRIGFDVAFATAGPGMPTTAGIGDTAFAAHNVQIRLPSKDLVKKFGIGFIAGTLKIEDAQTVRIDIARGTRLVNSDGQWLRGTKIECQIFLRGTRDAAGGFSELTDTAGQGLDGEPKPPSGGVMSGDGAAGGDFTTLFTVAIIAG